MALSGTGLPTQGSWRTGSGDERRMAGARWLVHSDWLRMPGAWLKSGDAGWLAQSGDSVSLAGTG